MGNKKIHPKCQSCNINMHTACSRVRVEGDTRPTAKIPFKPVGWYCQKCGALQSGDWLIQSSS